MLTRNDYDAYLKALSDTAKAAKEDLRTIWHGLDLSDASSVQSELKDSLYGYVQNRGDEAAELAASFYEAARGDIRPAYWAVPADYLDSDMLNKAINESTSILRRTGDASAAAAHLEQYIDGAVTGMARETVALNVDSDKIASSCASIPSLGCKCKWCLMHASRGFAFASKGNARDRTGVWHDNCQCQMVPGFGKNPRLEWFNPERYGKLRDHIENKQITFQAHAKPYEKELDVAIWLADDGHAVRFLKPTGEGRTADVLVDGVLREIKVPEGNNGTVGWLNASNQFKEATKNGLQSDKLIISEHLIKDLLEDGRDYLKEVRDFWHAEWPQFSEVWVMRATGAKIKLT